MTIFERLNPSIQAQVVASVDGLLVEEKKTNMFGVGAFIEKNHEHWLLGDYLYFKRLNIPSSMCTSIYVCRFTYLVEDP
jgi:hypothetical protein